MISIVDILFVVSKTSEFLIINRPDSKYSLPPYHSLINNYIPYRIQSMIKAINRPIKTISILNQSSTDNFSTP